MPPLPRMGEPKDKRAAKTEGSYMDSKNQRESRPEELVIPLWEEAGPSCPMDNERQRNPDALDRHVPAATGWHHLRLCDAGNHHENSLPKRWSGCGSSPRNEDREPGSGQ